METALQTIDRLAKELDSLLPMQPEYQQKLDKKIRLEFNYNSNHIEGNTLTYGETELLLIFDKTTGNHELREYEEMKAHDVAFEMIKDWASDKERPLTETAIKELHKLLLVRPFWKEAITPDGQPTRRLIEVGEYKKHPNSVRLQNGEIFHYTSPEETPMQMGELMEWYKDEEKALHPLTLAAMLHYKFVRIHPFDDGNGRISRLLMNYVLLKNNLPPVIIKSEDKKNYLFALNQADTGNYEPFISYMAEQLIWSLNISITIAKGEKIDTKGDLDKKIALLEKDFQRIGSEQEVKMHFNKEVFLSIKNTWLFELTSHVIPVIQKFNKLFLGSNHSIGITQSAIHVPFVKEPVKQIIENFSIECQRQADRLNLSELEFQINANYGTLIKGGDKTFGCAYSIRIKFEKIAYSIFMDKFEKDMPQRTSTELYKKLLHIPVTNAEINDITENFGEQIYEHIDFYSKKNGLR